jgi:hypothetical protein
MGKYITVPVNGHAQLYVEHFLFINSPAVWANNNTAGQYSVYSVL